MQILQYMNAEYVYFTAVKNIALGLMTDCGFVCVVFFDLLGTLCPF